MQVLHKISHSIICLLVFFSLQSCMFMSKSPPAKLDIVYIGGEQLNPDINDRPSPLVVTVCQLKSTTTFKNTDFFNLSNQLKLTLTDDLLQQEQIEVRPSQTITMTQ